MTGSTGSKHRIGRRGLVVLGGATVAVAAIGLPAAAALGGHASGAVRPGVVAVSTSVTTSTSATTSTASSTTPPTATSSSSAPVTSSDPGFVPEQQRLLDTRYDAPFDGPVAGLVQVQTDVPAGDTIELTLTATQAQGNGYITAYPDGGAAPHTSNLNFTAARTWSSTAVVLVGDDGVVDLNVVGASTDVLVDELGYTTAASFDGRTPTRVGDSRYPATSSNPNGLKQGAGTGVVTLQLPSGSYPAGSGTVALNVTAQPASTGAGYVATGTGGATPPHVSSLNFNGSQIATNLVFVQPSATGTVSLDVEGAPAYLIVDLDGYAPAGSSFSTASPQRIGDSRYGTGFPTTGRLSGVNSLTLSATQAPAGTSAVVLNVTAVEPTGVGYVNTFPGGSAAPHTSQVQYVNGLTIAQTIVVPVGSGGVVSFDVVGAPAYLVVDLEGTIGQDATTTTSSTSVAPTTSTSVAPTTSTSAPSTTTSAPTTSTSAPSTTTSAPSTTTSAPSTTTSAPATSSTDILPSETIVP